METLADRLDANAGRRADALAFRFLPTGDVAGSHVTLTHGQLNRKVERVAARLRQACMPGDRALLFYPSGLDFVVAFLACLRAGVIAVPVAGPGGERPERALARAAGCASDCAASLLLTTAIVDEGAGPGMMPELALLPRLVTDLAAGTGGRAAAVRAARGRCRRVYPVHLGFDRIPARSHGHAREPDPQPAAASRKSGGRDLARTWSHGCPHITTWA